MLLIMLALKVGMISYHILFTATGYSCVQNFSYLSEKQIPRCYFDKCSEIISIQLHGFCDASEKAYAGVVYIRSIGNVKGSLVAAAKSKVAPIKKMTIPQNVSCVELIYLLS